MLEDWLNAGEAMEAETGAMTYMTSNIAVTTKVRESNFISALGLKISGANPSSSTNTPPLEGVENQPLFQPFSGTSSF